MQLPFPECHIDGIMHAEPFRMTPLTEPGASKFPSYLCMAGWLPPFYCWKVFHVWIAYRISYRCLPLHLLASGWGETINVCVQGFV